MNSNRRALLKTVAQSFIATATLACCRDSLGNSHAHPVPSHIPTNRSDRALMRLMQGNRHFSEHKFHYPHQTAAWREHIALEQHPFAVVLGCSDSRVPPEIIFDEGLGDLFVVREAGHVADDATLGTIEYAVGHLDVPLVMVLGHENCGAVNATLDAVRSNIDPPGHLCRLVDDIRPAVLASRRKHGEDFDLDLAVRTNTTMVVDQLKKSGPLLNRYVEEGRVKIVGAYYDLHTGKVELMKG